MTAHGSEENGLSWSDGQFDYDKLRKTICEAVSGYVHLYAYGIAKTKFLTTLLAQPVRNLEYFKCPQPTASRRNSIAVCRTTRIIKTTAAQLETRIHYSNDSSITFIPATISTLHPNLHAIPPSLIRVYHSSRNDVVFLSFYSCIKRR